MPFLPSVGQELNIEGVAYQVAEHPAARSMPYGQEGRQAVVYQLVSGREQRAIKVFKPRYRVPGLVSVARRLAPYASVPGLQVCRRSVLIPQNEPDLLRAEPDLLYAVLMPWIVGPTWMEVLLERRPLTPEQSLDLAHSFAGVLAGMEQEGLAHCDLSGPNVMLPALAGDSGRDAQGDGDRLSARRGPSPIELVDLEQLYGPELRRPDLVPAGSSGYAHKEATEGMWGPDADRFAGAAILAEMLGMCDERVRTASWGESYFDPEELQRDSERSRVLSSVLRERWGVGVAQLFGRAWKSELLTECPTFGEWLVMLPDSVSLASPVAQPESASADASTGATSPTQERSLFPDVPTATAEPEGTRVEELYHAGEVAYTSGDLLGARELLAEVVRREPGYSRNGSSASDLLARIEAQLALARPVPPAARSQAPANVAAVTTQEPPPAAQPPPPPVPAAPVAGPQPPVPAQWPSTPQAPAAPAYPVQSVQPGTRDRRRWALLSIPALLLVVLAIIVLIILLQGPSASQLQAQATATAETVQSQQDTATAEAILVAGTQQAQGDQATQQAADSATAQALANVTDQAAATEQAVEATGTAQVYAGATSQAEQANSRQASRAATAQAIRAGYTATPKQVVFTVANRDRLNAVHVLRGHVGYVSGLAFSPDGKLIASASLDRKARLWRASDGVLVGTIDDLQEDPLDLAFSPDGSALAVVGYGGIYLWEVSDGLQIGHLTGDMGSLTSVAFSPDGSLIAAGTSGGVGTLGIWRTADGTLVKEWQAQGNDVNGVAFSPDGKLLVSGSADKTVKLWQVPDGSLIRALGGPADVVHRVTFSPDGQYVAAASEDGFVWMWTVADGALKQKLGPLKDKALSVAFSPDGQVLASSGSYEGTVQLWRVQDGALMTELNGHYGSAVTLAFSPDGQLIASGGEDNYVRVWGVPPPNATPTPTPIVVAGSTPAELNGLKITASNSRVTTEGAPNSDGSTPVPSSGYEFVAIQLTVENTSDQPKPLYIPGEFKIWDSQGRSYNYANYVKMSPSLWDLTKGTIAPHAKVTGEVAFEVRTDINSSDPRLVYGPINWPGEIDFKASP